MHAKPLRIALNLTKLIQNQNIGDKLVFRWYSPSRRSSKSFQNINSLFHLKSYKTMTSAGSAPTKAYLAFAGLANVRKMILSRFNRNVLPQSLDQLSLYCRTFLFHFVVNPL